MRNQCDAPAPPLPPAPIAKQGALRYLARAGVPGAEQRDSEGASLRQAGRTPRPTVWNPAVAKSWSNLNVAAQRCDCMSAKLTASV